MALIEQWLAPLSVPLALAIYFTIWWIALFAVLPFGVRSQQESGHVIKGTDPGAPQNAHMGRKVLYTTLLASIIFLGMILFMRYAG